MSDQPMSQLTSQTAISVVLLYQRILASLVDHPEDVQVAAFIEADRIVFKVHSHPRDMVKLMGDRGDMWEALRDLLSAYGERIGVQLELKLITVNDAPHKSGRFQVLRMLS